ncbi:MAG TPA: hypothetical protein VFO37_07995, partial [Chitinophagaceae bacterium]|nr:hypothetical protein [Chitinophagaceae bacterium]
YTTDLLTASDANTIQCKVSKGTTYIPIPPSTGQNYAGLITIDLPPTVVKGQEFNIIVRRITSRRYQEDIIAKKPVRKANAKIDINWRYVVGTFQIKIPVSTKDKMLFGEENTIAIMKWRLQAMNPSNRWYPVLQRYISYLSARVDGMGGNSDSIKPSLEGVPVKPADQREEYEEHTGKVCEVIFNCFGDFEGFLLSTCNDKHVFKTCCSKSLLEIVLRACKDNLTVKVFIGKDTKKIMKLVIKC